MKSGASVYNESLAIFDSILNNYSVGKNAGIVMPGGFVDNNFGTANNGFSDGANILTGNGTYPVDDSYAPLPFMTKTHRVKPQLPFDYNNNPRGNGSTCRVGAVC